MSNVVIFGATSAIAQAVAKLYAKKGDRLYLIARNNDRLQAISDDLKVLGANDVLSKAIDLTDSTQHEALLLDVKTKLQNIDVLLIAYGTLSDQAACEKDAAKTLSELNINGLSVISLLTHAANQFEQQGNGSIAVISSVAGDRGRQSNYVYGTAKAALSIFLQGLRNRFGKTDVHVLTIKPGFVDTPMTKDFTKGLLWSKPETIAAGIVKAIRKKKSVVYLPFFWRYIMLIIIHIPEFIFKKLSL